MAQHGVQCLDCYCVDNALARVGDPRFVGACAAAGAKVGARVVCRTSPDEKVRGRAGCCGQATCCIGSWWDNYSC